MIELGYQIRDDSYMETYAVKPEKLDEGNLLYQCFLGDIVFKGEGVDFSAPWGWVPVLHFALVMRDIAQGLAKHPDEQYEFTESEATISFRKTDEAVQITASYAPGSIEVSLKQLTDSSEKLLDDIVSNLTKAHPDIKNNATLQRLVKEGLGDK